jgi:uncharacterized membrane protein
MTNENAWIAVVGGIAVLVTLLLYAGGSLFRISEEQAVNFMAVIMLVAFFGVTVYEDWKDARQARQRSRRS